jgi:hypothetical protein
MRLFSGNYSRIKTSSGPRGNRDIGGGPSLVNQRDRDGSALAVPGFQHHGLVNGTSHSVVAKRERLRDKSPPSAALRRITAKELP